MSLFRRKFESNNAPDESSGASPSPEPGAEEGSIGSEALQDGREIDDPFAGAITVPAPGEIVSGLVEVRVLPAAPVPEPVELWLEWSRDELNWQRIDSSGASRLEVATTGSVSHSETLLPPLKWDTSSLPDGPCFLRLISSDSRGLDTRSEPVSLQIDNLGPELRLRERPAGGVLSGLVTVTVDAEDLVSGVSLVELEIASGGGRWRRVSEARAAPFALRLSTEELSDGQYELRVAARDGSGNSNRGEPWTVEIANSAAAAELVDPGEHLHGHVNLIARAADKRSTQMIFEIAAAGSDEWRALGTARAPFHLSVDTRPLVDGVYELRIESLTAGGQSTYSRRFGPYIVDNTPPAVAIVAPHDGDTVKGWVELVTEVADDASGVARVELSYAEADEWRLLAELEPQKGEVRGFWQTEEMSPGECRLRATAFDRAGNEASQVISVTIASQAPQPGHEGAAATSAHGTKPARSEPSSARPPSPKAADRFGQVPSWEWERPVQAESESPSSEPSAGPEPGPEPGGESSRRTVTVESKPQSPTKGVAWSWKAPQADEEPRPERTPELETAPESKPEPHSKSKPEPEPPSEPESQSKSKPEPEPPSEPEPEEKPAVAMHLVEPLQVEKPEASDEGRGENAAPEEAHAQLPEAERGGSVVDFPRAARGWDIWELSELVEETPGQDPVRQEERRQILYHLREHTAVDGRIPPEFDGLVHEVFGELMHDDSGV